MNTPTTPMLPFPSDTKPAPLAKPTPTERELPIPHNHTPTSMAAARQIRASTGTDRARILRFITECGANGATDEETQQALGLKVQTETPRRNELVRLGEVQDSGRVRLTSSRRKAVVWIAVQEGGSQ